MTTNALVYRRHEKIINHNMIFVISYTARVYVMMPKFLRKILEIVHIGLLLFTKSMYINTSPHATKT